MSNADDDSFEGLEGERELGIWNEQTDDEMREAMKEVMDRETLGAGEFFALVFLASGRGHFMALDGLASDIKKAYGTRLLQIGSATYRSKRGPVKFYVYREPKPDHKTPVQNNDRPKIPGSSGPFQGKP